MKIIAGCNADACTEYDYTATLRILKSASVTGIAKSGQAIAGKIIFPCVHAEVNELRNVRAGICEIEDGGIEVHGLRWRTEVIGQTASANPIGAVKICGVPCPDMVGQLIRGESDAKESLVGLIECRVDIANCDLQLNGAVSIGLPDRCCRQGDKECADSQEVFPQSRKTWCHQFSSVRVMPKYI